MATAPPSFARNSESAPVGPEGDALTPATVADVGEHALIARITSRLPPPPPWMVVGPGDDAAVIEHERNTVQVLTTDAIVEGVHFDQRFVPPDAIGHRALAVNLSDVAAMGAMPRAALLSLLLPSSFPLAAFDAMVDGLIAAATPYRVAVVGGNITRSPGPLVVDVTVTGHVHPRRVLRRSGARPGDDIYVTGTLGDARIGLQALRGKDSPDELKAPTPAGCAQRFLRPEPRVRAGVLLGRNRVASSCMDLSDGLADGLRQVALASSVGMQVDATLLPISEEARQWHQLMRTDPVDAALAGGDDYELLFTVRPSHRGRLRSIRPHLASIGITRIGSVRRGAGVVVSNSSGRELPPGFEHFR